MIGVIMRTKNSKEVSKTAQWSQGERFGQRKHRSKAPEQERACCVQGRARPEWLQWGECRGAFRQRR